MTALPCWSPRLTFPLLVLLSSCIADPPSDDLIGTWKTAPVDLEPSGWYETLLGFSKYGAFESEVRSYGIHPGQDRNELSAYSRIEGTYRIDGDRLSFESNRLVWWEPQFYGSQEQVLEPYRISLYDDGRYDLEGERLLLQYTAYPADAPVPASMEFARER
jgi:hypothetical protein